MKAYYLPSSCLVSRMTTKMFDANRVIALLEIVANQERVNRFHNAPYGETLSYQNTLMVLLGRHAVFESSSDGAVVKITTIIKKYGGLKSLWESIMAQQVWIQIEVEIFLASLGFRIHLHFITIQRRLIVK